MIISKEQVILAGMFVLISIKCVESLFERQNKRIDLQTNVTFPLKSLKYQRDSSTRVVFVGQPGDRLALDCNINFSKCRRRGGIRRNRECRPGGCSDDYFYVGYDTNSRIRGAEYYCGKKTIRKKSRLTTNRRDGRPVLVVATSATKRGLFGKYKCVIQSIGISTAPVTVPPATTTVKDDDDDDDNDDDNDDNADDNADGNK